MKFLNLFLAATLIIFCCASCKKDTKPPENTPLLKIKSYTEEITSSTTGHTVETFNLQYDNDNRLTSLESVSASGSKFIYEYTSANAFTMDIFQANSLVIHEDFFLNGLTLVDSTFQYNNTADTSTEKYLYNSGKQLEKKYEYDVIGGNSELYNTITYTYNSQGNLITEVDDYSTTTYSYDEVILNTLTTSPIYLPLPKQLPTKMVYNSLSDSYTIEHTYTFDATNRLTVDKAEFDNGDIVLKTYTYF